MINDSDLRQKRVITETKSDGSFLIFTQSCFDTNGGGAEINSGQRWIQFKEAGYPRTNSIASSTDAGSFVVFFVSISAVKQLSGTEVNTSDGTIAALGLNRIEVNVCSVPQFIATVNGNTTRANVLTALRALTEFTQPTTLKGKNPQMCAVTVSTSAASRALANLDLQFYSTGV